ncbi:MAG: HAMP domain-containing protein [Proteobacteria bacterium]|nr:HAMP domain-containing protein [Pseudomonadota bacterium]
MRLKKSIALKIAVFIGIFIFVLQLVSGLLTNQMEQWLINKIMSSLQATTQSNLEVQKESELKKLQETILFNSKTLSGVIAVNLYNFEEAGPALMAYMDVAEIQAIVVLDESKKSYSAVWRKDKVYSGKSLPEDYSIEGLVLVEVESKYQGNRVGRIKVFYSHQLLEERYGQIEKKTLKDFADTRQSVEELQSTITSYQVIGLIVIAVLFLLVMFLFIQRIIGPLKKLADRMLEVENTGDFSKYADTSSEDEVGDIAKAFNSLLHNLHSSIGDVNDVMNAVAQGEMSKRVTGVQKGDLNHLKNSINDSVELLSKTIFQVMNSSNYVNSASSELSSSAQSLARGTSEQAASLQEISSSMNEVESQTKANNENAHQAQQLSGQTLEIVQKGNQSMENMLQSIKEINDTSSKVSKVIKVIDEIAFQTNLLALNAAVEAARAGKSGKGFAVVAEEVRSLASRSAEAAKDTTALIEASIKEVEKGVKNADQTAAVLNEISTSVDKNNDLVGEISAASKEQSRGIGEINHGLTQVNSIIQQNSSISEETASSSVELSSHATKLQEMIGKFNLGEETMRSELQQKPVKLASRPAMNLPQEAGEPAPRLDHDVDTSVESRKVITLDDGEFGKY